ncbi:type II toxin-antitoxin system RelE/ParE family toxin [Bradyrhizobium cenepequi]|uniref:type II toxin-antitoxin system RelE/ParE family toxin n=1 Tax=Bradyrhizobium cenepequi TaxID=2821403 RepID=UPI001CE248E5|nr:type II toxin-antitoxin system RelE/ParE family toxin [Bradyrhizobium cenepequi]MCA6108055.1 type II toxin-antitoxin system RelE/ParE family toxin [Bradyrhizobium cenepequi]
MQTVIRTPTFLADAKGAGLSDNEQDHIVAEISKNPLIGDIMEGTGGCRKVRFAGRGRGKSGGYRTVHYFAGDDVPVLLLALINKGERANLSKAERNALRVELERYADDYRKGVAAKVAEMRKG